MKKFFAFAIALVSMAAAMTSCNNDNDDFVAQKAPVVQQTVVKEAVDLDFVVVVSPEQTNYMDETYVVEMGGQQKTVKVANMTQADANMAQKLAKSLESDFNVLGSNKVLFYTYSLGQIKPNETAKVVSYNATMKENHPTEEFDVVRANCFYNSARKTLGTTSFHLFKGVAGDDDSVTSFAQEMTGCPFGTSFTY